MIHFRSMLLVAVAFLAGSARAQTPTYSGLVFANLGGQDLLLDLYIPATGTPPYPLAIYIHAGAWQCGSRDPISPLGNLLLAQGFAVASVDYRLTSQAGQFGAYPVTFPAQIHDVKGAVRWLRANAAAYQLDSDRFASFGESAGGHLSELLALSAGASELEGDVGGNLGFSSAVQAASSYFGSSDLLNMKNDVTTPPLWDYDAPTSSESALVGWDGPGQGLGDIKAHFTDPSLPYPILASITQQAAPVAWVDSTDPPLFLAHGTSDTTVPVNQTTRLSAALYAAGVRHEVLDLPRVGHGFGQGSMGSAIDIAAAEFLREQLVGPALPSAGVQYCFGDGTALACPCSNTSWSGARLGCTNSLAVGASLTAYGIASIALDELVLRGNGMLNSSALYVQGTQKSSSGAGVVYGDGLRCVAGGLVRLGLQSNVNGSSQYPMTGQTSLSVRGGATAGTTLHYQVWYRDRTPLCSTATWNLTNGLSVTWAP